MNLLYFAWVRQKIGKAEECLDLPPGVTNIADLMSHLRRRGGGYDAAFSDPRRLRAARNQEHASFDSVLRNEDEIAFFPPVTGG